MRKLSDNGILLDLENKRANKIKQICKMYNSDKEKFFVHLTDIYKERKGSWNDWRDFLKKKQDDLIQKAREGHKYDEKELHKVWDDLDKLEGFGPSWSKAGYRKLYELPPNDYSVLQLRFYLNFLEEIAKEGLIASFYRLVGMLEELYDYEQYYLHLSHLKYSIKERKPPEKNFPLTSFIFTFYTGVFFCSSYIFDVIEFKGCATNIDNDENKKKVLSHFTFLKTLLHYLDAFALYHPLLYLTGKWYRDHLLHSIRVTWLMDQLFEAWKNYYLRSAEYRLKYLLSRCDTYVASLYNLLN